MSETRPPKMNRSRGQLATVYAPHSLFTFEGGAGACMARPAYNRPYDPASPTTKRNIHEQIVEFLEWWLRRATSGRDTVVPVVPERALDPAALRHGRVHLPIGSVHFQVPERVGYLPFPLAFVCTRCSLHRYCADEAELAGHASRFRDACPQGADECADDWQQLDVVMAHWSGAVEALTPMRRHARAGTLAVELIDSCQTCSGRRFYLRRNGATFARWRFECVDCGTTREIRLADHDTLELLKQDLAQGSNVLPQINMEPVSCRASSAYYSQGDRLLVFGTDRWIALLQSTNAGQLGRFLASQFGFPPEQLDDADRERLLRDAGRGGEWENYAALREMHRSMANAPASLAALRDAMARLETKWAEDVFAARTGPPSALAAAIEARANYVRRFDPIRMAVEHRTLLDECLRNGACLADGKLTSVDVTRPDEFMIPDAAADAPRRQRMVDEVARRLQVLGIAEMRLVRGLQVCEYTFGYTRTSSTPLVQRQKAGTAEMPVRLNLFGRVRVGDVPLHPVLCLEQTNEAFYVRLDESAVLDWLSRIGIRQSAEQGQPGIGGRLIEAYSVPDMPFRRFLDEYRREGSRPRSAYPYVYTLLHSVAHHLILTCAAMSGLDLGSFGEHLFVPDLALLVYRRGMTMDLGNLSSMWRDRGDPVVGNEVLDRMASAESLRCGSESVCTHHGGACPDCILIPETACLTRNELLTRSVLSGRGTPRWDMNETPLVGFYETAAERIRSGATPR